MKILYAALGGFALDLLLGDPAWMPHPVVFMGRYITKLEGFLRKICPNELLGGGILAITLPLGTLALSALAGLLVMFIGQAVKWSQIDDQFTGGIKIMAAN